MSKLWTDEEVESLKLNYGTKSIKELLEIFKGKTSNQINSKANYLGLNKLKHFWSENDIKILIESYNKHLSIDQIINNLQNKYSESSIRTKATKLKLVKDFFWEDWEINYLKEHYSNTPINEILKVLNKRKRLNIINYAKKLGLQSIVVWTKEEDEFLINNYKKLNDRQMIEFLPNRTWRSIKARRNILKLDKTNGGFGNVCISQDGKEFCSQEERDIYEYLKYKTKFQYVKSIGNKRNGRYVFDVTDLDNKYYKFCPDFVVENIISNGKNIKLNKPIIIEYYGLYRLNIGNSPIRNRYQNKIDAKNKFYTTNSDIYFMPIYPNDILNNYKGIDEKINKFLQTNNL